MVGNDKRDAPINIKSAVINNKSRSCDANCSYSFQYNTSSCNVKNEGNFLRIPYDTGNGYPVNCDGVDYKVDRIDIYQPSLHRYDGQTAAAEILAYHTSSTGDNLIVSIPIIVGNTNGRQSSEIMNEILKNLPTSTSTTKTINTITNFNLGNLVPKEGFFIYTGKNLLTPYTGIYKYIVYHTKDAITISRDALANLTVASKSTSISPSQTLTSETMPDTLYFYNKRGANKSGGKDEYYLKCNPTGDDGTILYQKAIDGDGSIGTIGLDNSKGLNWNWKEMFNSNGQLQKIVFALFGVILAIIIFYLLRVILEWLGDKFNNATNDADGGNSSTTAR
jgi:carbonic anhydrase